MVENKKKKVLGAAAGAAAAAAVGVAAARMKGGKPAVYHVRSREDGWAVERDGNGKASSRFETKRQAVQEGRKLASGQAPSRLVIHRRDDSVQKEHSYDVDG